MSPRNHTWKWLPTRFTTFRPATPSASGATRPPLSVLEPLEDRVLLSASDGGGGTSDALIGLLRGQLGLRTDEINFLKDAGGIIVVDKTMPITPAENAFLKIEQDFLKIDGAVNKLTEHIVLRKAGHDQQEFLKIKLQDVIVTSFADIDQELQKISPEAGKDLLPAVQQIQDETTSFTDSLFNTPGLKGIVDHKLAGEFMKYENELQKVDVIVERVSFKDIHIVKNTDKSSPSLMLKLDDAFAKMDHDLAGMGDGSVFKALADDVSTYKGNVIDFITSFGKPAGGPD